MNPTTYIVAGIVFIVLQVSLNFFAGWMLWQMRHSQQRRDQEIADLRHDHEGFRERIDERCQVRLANQHERDVSMAVQVERTMQTALREFATKADLQQAEEIRRQDTQRIFASLDKMARDVAVVKDRTEEASDG